MFMHKLFVCVSRLTHGLRRQYLRESSRERDEHYGVGDPGDVLQEHVAVQSTIHPLLCCTHTQTRARTHQDFHLRINEAENDTI